jgi:hypothetical protein
LTARISRERELGPVLDDITVPVRYVVASGTSFGSRGDEQEKIRTSLGTVTARNPNIHISAKVASNHGAILKKDSLIHFSGIAPGRPGTPLSPIEQRPGVSGPPVITW